MHSRTHWRTRPARVQTAREARAWWRAGEASEASAGPASRTAPARSAAASPAASPPRIGSAWGRSAQCSPEPPSAPGRGGSCRARAESCPVDVAAGPVCCPPKDAGPAAWAPRGALWHVHAAAAHAGAAAMRRGGIAAERTKKTGSTSTATVRASRRRGGRIARGNSSSLIDPGSHRECADGSPPAAAGGPGASTAVDAVAASTATSLKAPKSSEKAMLAVRTAGRSVRARQASSRLT